MRGKEFNDSIHDTFEHFWKTKEYGNVSWFLLASLDKVIKEKNELGRSNFPAPDANK
jgi:hypothetical protein